MNTSLRLAPRALIVALALCGLSACGAEDDGLGSKGLSQVGGPTFQLAFAPPVANPGSALTGVEHVELRDRTRVTDTEGAPGAVTSLGSLTLGASSVTGDVHAWSNVWLRSQARLDGDLSTTGSVELQHGALITGASQTGLSLKRPALVEVEVQYPADSEGAREIGRGHQVTLSGGRYSQVMVRAGGTLTLDAGKYYLDSLTVEPNAQLFVRSSLHPTQVYIAQQLKLEGSVRDSFHEERPDYFFAYFGQNSVHVTGSFVGHLIARSAEVVFSSQKHHVGSVFARRINLEADTSFRYFPFLATRFAYQDGAQLGECSGNSWPSGTEKTVCLSERLTNTNSTVMTVNGHIVPSADDCVTVTVRAPSVEVRAFELDAEGREVASDYALLTVSGGSFTCPLYERVIMGTLGDDELVGTEEDEYISGGPGDDLITPGGGRDVLVGGDGADEYDLRALSPIQIEWIRVLNDASDRFLLDFVPGNPAGLFPLVDVQPTPTQIVPLLTRFHTLDIAASADDLADALGLANIPQISLSSLGVVRAQTLPETRLDILGARAVRVQNHQTNSSAYAALLHYTIDDSFCDAPGCNVSAISLLDGTGKIQGEPLALDRRGHLLTDIVTRPNREGGHIYFSGYTNDRASGCTNCRERAFLGRFDVGARSLDWIEYFDGRVRDYDGSDSEAAQSSVFYSLAIGPNTVMGVGTRLGEPETQVGNWIWGRGGPRIAGAVHTGYVASTGLNGGGPRVRLAFHSSTLYPQTSNVTRFKMVTVGGTSEEISVTVAGHAGDGHFYPYVARFVVPRVGGEPTEVRDRQLYESGFFSEVEGIGYPGGGQIWISSSTNRFNSDDSFRLTGFVSALDANSLEPVWTNGRPITSSFHGNYSGYRLFGGSAHFEAAGMVSAIRNVLVGTIHSRWSDSLWSTAATHSEGRPFFAEIDRNGETVKAKSIDILAGNDLVDVSLVGTVYGYNGGGVIAYGYACDPQQTAQCVEKPFLIGVNQYFEQSSCSCDDGIANCGELGIDCGSSLCPTSRRTCPDVEQVPTPNPTPTPTPTPVPACAVNPTGSEMGDSIDHKLAAAAVAGCAGCHGAGLRGGFAPCLIGAGIDAGSCFHDTIAGGRTGGMPAYTDQALYEAAGRTGTAPACMSEIVTNYLISLTGTCNAGSTAPDKAECR